MVDPLNYLSMAIKFFCNLPPFFHKLTPVRVLSSGRSISQKEGERRGSGSHSNRNNGSNC
jgi:hypothetical protein